MKLNIDNQLYTLSTESETFLTMLVQDRMQDALEKFPAQYRLMGDQVARQMLYSFEKKAIENGMTKDDAKRLRPDKGQSALTKLLDIVMSQNLSKFVENIQLNISTHGNEVDVSYEAV